uniref:Unannotated protein n=1 Tax=freshwater metagenome TaxID=449393 RepID=A0A6J5Z9Y4_9ZZZZ
MFFVATLDRSPLDAAGYVNFGKAGVDRPKDLGPRTVVGCQATFLAALLVIGGELHEHVEVGIAESVDRLERIADLKPRRHAKRIEQLKLQPVCVLELVNQDALETLAVGGRDRRMVGQQVPGCEDHIGKVAAAVGPFQRRILLAVGNQQPIQEPRPLLRILRIVKHRQAGLRLSCAPKLLVDAVDLLHHVVEAIRRQQVESLGRVFSC